MPSDSLDRLLGDRVAPRRADLGLAIVAAVDTQIVVTSRPCDLCGRPIGADRIEALPRTTTCFACASLRKRPSRGRTCS